MAPYINYQYSMILGNSYVALINLSLIIFINSPTIEIGRYQSHIESIEDRFIGYQVDADRNCIFAEDKTKECWHLKLAESFKNSSRLNAFQLGMCNYT